MRSKLAFAYSVLVFALIACGGGGSGSPAEPSPAPLRADPSTEPLRTDAPPTEALRAEPPQAPPHVEEGDRVDTRRGDHEEPHAAIAAQPSTRAAITITRIDSGEAEDGAGNVNHVEQRIAVDLDAHTFPPRARDPVLQIGRLRFVHYSHPHPGVLRFTLDDRSRLPLGAEVSVQYGSDVASRRVVLQAISSTDLEGLAR